MNAGSDPLAEALSRMNGARSLDRSDPKRLHGLLEAFQALLDVETEGSSRRDLDADGAVAELEAALKGAGADAGLTELQAWLEPILDRLVEGLLTFPERRLAVYGSLAPGEANHHHVSTLVGEWSQGVVSGTLHDRGWSARQGFPTFVWDAAGPDVSVSVLGSAALAGAWDRLDAFEGADYRRILVPVWTEARVSVCNLYELADAIPSS